MTEGGPLVSLPAGIFKFLSCLPFQNLCGLNIFPENKFAIAGCHWQFFSRLDDFVFLFFFSMPIISYTVPSVINGWISLISFACPWLKECSTDFIVDLECYLQMCYWLCKNHLPFLKLVSTIPATPTVHCKPCMLCCIHVTLELS